MTSHSLSPDRTFGKTPDEFDNWVHGLTLIRRDRPRRRVTMPQSPRCPICGETIRHVRGRLHESATRYVDGVETHRKCLGD